MRRITSRHVSEMAVEFFRFVMGLRKASRIKPIYATVMLEEFFRITVVTSAPHSSIARNVSLGVVVLVMVIRRPPKNFASDF